MRHSDGFVDVGSNVGVYSLLAASIAGRDSEIIAIEPAPSSRWQLLEHVAANRLERVHVVAAAAGRRPGWVKMTTGLGPSNHVIEYRSEPPEQRDQWTACTSLDEVCAGASPAFGKMDVEGYELEVLEGAKTLLRNRRPAAWIIEVNGTGERYGNNVENLVRHLHAYGGALFRYDPESNVLVPYDPVERSDDHNPIAVVDRAFIEARLRT